MRREELERPARLRSRPPASRAWPPPSLGSGAGSPPCWSQPATLSGLTRGLGEPLPATWVLGTSSEKGRAGRRKAGRKAARARVSKSSRAGLALQWPELLLNKGQILSLCSKLSDGFSPHPPGYVPVPGTLHLHLSGRFFHRKWHGFLISCKLSSKAPPHPPCILALKTHPDLPHPVTPHRFASER